MDDKNNLKPKYFYHLDENKEDSFENLKKQSVDLIKNNDHLSNFMGNSKAFRVLC